MKNNRKLVIALLVLFNLIGCNSNKHELKIENNEFENLDTILRRNQENFETNKQPPN